jgi:hypothetical protein
MDILNEDEFEKKVREYFLYQNINIVDVDSKYRNKDFLIKQELFFNLTRTHHRHTPDILIVDDNVIIPCELKSQKEIYDVCKYSKAHLCSYILQTIFGQCFSYADLFRDKNNELSIYLIMPRLIIKNVPSFNDIIPIFKQAISNEWSVYKLLMEIKSIKFSAPIFSEPHDDRKFGIIKDNAASFEALITKITYHTLER